MSKDALSTARAPVELSKWIALLGRRDTPTDGIEDYCSFLAESLTLKGIELARVRVPWNEIGWIGSLRHLLRDSSEWRGKWLLLQYTAFMWSRRGFPWGIVAALAILKWRGVHVAIVLHEYRGQQGPRFIDRLRGTCQDWVVRSLYRSSEKTIFTVPLETVAWLPKGECKAAFISIGANIPERVNRRLAPALSDREKTVIVFGVTGAPVMAQEVEQIAFVMGRVSNQLGKMRLVVVGRGSAEAKDLLVKSLEGCRVEVVVRGILPADEIAREFESADVLLFLRGAVSPQRGSAIAGIACGLPIVGYRNGDTGKPLKESGVEWSPWQDRESLIRGLVKVLSDPNRWTELHERNVELQKNCFSWSAIAEKFFRLLTTREGRA